MKLLRSLLLAGLGNTEAKLGTRNTERTAKHGDRSRRQVVLCTLLTGERQSRGRPIRLGVTSLPIWMPLVLLLAKCNHRYPSDERCVLMTAGIMEEHEHLVWMIVVLVDEHQ